MSFMKRLVLYSIREGRQSVGRPWQGEGKGLGGEGGGVWEHLGAGIGSKMATPGAGMILQHF